MSAIEKAREAVAQALAQLGKDFVMSSPCDDKPHESKQTDTCTINTKSLEQVTRTEKNDFVDQSNIDDDLAIVVEAPAQSAQLPSTATAWKHALEKKNCIRRGVRAKQRNKKAQDYREIDLLDEYYRPAPLTTLSKSAEPEEGECSSSSSSPSDSPQLHNSSVNAADSFSSAHRGSSSRYDIDQRGLPAWYAYDGRPQYNYVTSPHHSPRRFRSRSRSPYRSVTASHSRSRPRSSRRDRSCSRSSSYRRRYQHQRSRSRSFERKRWSASRSRSKTRSRSRSLSNPKSHKRNKFKETTIDKPRLTVASCRLTRTMQTQTHAASLEMSAARLRSLAAGNGAKGQALNTHSTKSKSNSTSRSSSCSSSCSSRSASRSSSTSTESCNVGRHARKHASKRTRQHDKRGKCSKSKAKASKHQPARDVRSHSTNSSSSSSSSTSSSASDSGSRSDSQKIVDHDRVRHSVPKFELKAKAASKRFTSAAKPQTIARKKNSLCSTAHVQMSRLRSRLKAERRKVLSAAFTCSDTNIKAVDTDSQVVSALATNVTESKRRLESTNLVTTCHSSAEVVISVPVHRSETRRVTFQHIEEARAELINQLAAIERIIAEKRAMLKQLKP